MKNSMERFTKKISDILYLAVRSHDYKHDPFSQKTHLDLYQMNRKEE